MKIKLGDIAKDSVTGFQGVVIGRSTYLYNVDRLVIQPRELKEGKRASSQSFDEPGLIYVSVSDVDIQKPATDDFSVGDVVREKVTGFEGIITTRTQWISGCYTISVQPQGLNKDGEPFASHAFEEPDCTLVKARNEKAPLRKVGGPKPEQKRLVR